ncbi:MAG: hypothetical protein R3C01_01605 [Planctomycetaceae bacterium]
MLVDTNGSKVAPFPKLDSGEPKQIWRQYFKANRPQHRSVARLVDRLLKEKQHQHVEAVIQSALTYGQSQPWMYEALAVSMEEQGRPAAEIERVVMSIADFGPADYQSMMFSARYLANLNRNAAALRACRSAAQILPERPESYVLGLALARKEKDVPSIEWAASGVLQHVWTRNYQEIHREAENVVLDTRQMLVKDGRQEEAQQLEATMKVARSRDIVASLVWTGTGDLDLIVEEPSGSICSFENPDSPGGGVLTRDGFGPDAKNCREEYICAAGQSGDYRFRVRHSSGDIAGKRGTLTIVRHAGTPQETITTRIITIGAEEPVVRMVLEEGRRTTPRQVSTARIDLPREPKKFAGQKQIGRGVILQTAAEFEADRAEAATRRFQRAGAFGFNPVITLIPDGITMTAAPIISPDRRYVRIAINPIFSTVTSVSTFSFLNGGNGATGIQPGTARGN